MAIQKDTVSIPLLKGINTKVDPNQEQVGQLTVLKNAKFTKIGSIAKRNGFGVLTKEFTTISRARIWKGLARLNYMLEYYLKNYNLNTNKAG